MQAMLLAGSTEMTAHFAKTASKEPLNHWGQKMSFDEQPDGDIHGECALEIRLLKELLSAQYEIATGMHSPFQCINENCPYLGHPCAKSCGCYHEALKIHLAQVRRAIK